MTKTTTPTLAARLEALNAFKVAIIAWARGFSSAEAAWEACSDPHWMLWGLSLWGLAATGRSDDRTLRLFACWCVRHTPLADGRTTWDVLTDPRSRTAVEVAERFAVGDATAEELRVAKDAAWDAVRVAVRPAAREAAGAAARAVTVAGAAVAAAEAAGSYTAGAAAWDAAGAAAREAAGAAAGAAGSDTARAEAWDAAWATARAAQANALRRLVGANPFLGE